MGKVCYLCSLPETVYFSFSKNEQHCEQLDESPTNSNKNVSWTLTTIVKAPYLKVEIHIQAFMSDGKREGYSLMSLRHLIEHLEVRAVNKKKQDYDIAIKV